MIDMLGRHYNRRERYSHSHCEYYEEVTKDMDEVKFNLRKLTNDIIFIGVRLSSKKRLSIIATFI